jgi:hypothetical protein
MAAVAVPAPVAADEQDPIHLAPGQEFAFHSDRPTVGSGAGVSLIFDPDECSAPPHSATCDAFLLTLERDPSEAATNFVLMELAWDGGAQIPDLVLVVAGLGLGTTTDYNLYLWEKDEEGAWTRRADVSGGFSVPELVGFIADKDEYAVTVQNSQGPSLGYDLSIKFSNEVFASPFESLDPALRDPGGGGELTPPVDSSADATPEPVTIETPSVTSGVTDEVAAGPLAPVGEVRPVATDADFTGFRGSVDDALTGDLASFQRAKVEAPEVPDAPSAAVLLFWLLGLPLAVVLAVYLWARRRRPAALTA